MQLIGRDMQNVKKIRKGFGVLSYGHDEFWMFKTGGGNLKRNGRVKVDT